MRFMVTFRVPTDSGNRLLRDGQLGQLLESILSDVKPEAAYFSDIDGARGGYLVVNIDDASQIPAVAEPLFLGVGATVEFHPVMTVQDLTSAMGALEQAAQKYR